MLTELLHDFSKQLYSSFCQSSVSPASSELLSANKRFQSFDLELWIEVLHTDTH